MKERLGFLDSIRAAKTIYAFIIIFSLAVFSLYVAHQTVYSDFPVFYAAAQTMLDPAIAGISVYDADMPGRYPVPEPSEKEKTYIYSMPIAYLLAPLALMSYYPAKATMIFINIVLYIAAIVLILRRSGVSGRWFFYPLFLSIAWLPFLQGIRCGQVNAIMFFLVTLAVIYASKNQYAYSAFFLAFAALFKLFPLGIAMALGFKNLRITVYCALFFGASLLIPGSMQWFPSIRNIFVPSVMPTYLFLKSGNLIALFYGVAIVGYTGTILYRFKDANAFLLVAFAIPAMFLIMPIVEYHHLTLLIFSYVFLLNPSNKKNKGLLLSMLLSFVMIDLTLFISHQSYLMVMPITSQVILSVGLFLLWLSVAITGKTGTLPHVEKCPSFPVTSRPQ